MISIQKITNIILFVITIILTVLLIVNFFNKSKADVEQNSANKMPVYVNSDVVTIKQIEEILQKYLNHHNNDEKFKNKVEEIIIQYLEQNPAKIAQAIEKDKIAKQEEEKDKIKNYIVENSDLIFSEYGGFALNDAQDEKTDREKIVFFYDYNCNYCKKGIKHLHEVLKNNPEIQLIMRPLPVLGKESMEAAQFILAMKKMMPAKIVEIDKDILEKRSVNKAVLQQIAQQNNIAPDQIKSIFSDVDLQVALGDNLNLAEKLKIKGAPAYIINNSVYSGMLDAEKIQALLARKAAQNKHMQKQIDEPKDLQEAVKDSQD